MRAFTLVCVASLVCACSDDSESSNLPGVTSSTAGTGGAAGHAGSGGSAQGGAPSGACNEDPWSCAPGQTCWLDLSSSFECLEAGPGTTGSSCELQLGTATCAEDLFCYQMAGSGGMCTPFCDAAHPCPNGAECVTVSASSSDSVDVCQP